MAFSNDTLMRLISRQSSDGAPIGSFDTDAQLTSALHQVLHARVSPFRNDQNPSDCLRFFGKYGLNRMKTTHHIFVNCRQDAFFLLGRPIFRFRFGISERRLIRPNSTDTSSITTRIFCPIEKRCPERSATKLMVLGTHL